MIDPGHGGYDSGAVGADNATYEKDITMKIAYKVGQQIQSLDPEIGILFTRTDDNVSWPADETADLLARITMAQEQNADYFLSIHLNSSTNPEAYGYHSFVRSNDPFSQDVADRIAANLEKNKYSYDRETVFTDQTPLMVVDNLSIPSFCSKSVLFPIMTRCRSSKTLLSRIRLPKRSLLPMWTRSMICRKMKRMND